MAFTKNLNIPKLEPQNIFDVVKDVNSTIDAIDKNALSITHEQSKSHFDMWQPNTPYKKGDVIRTTTIPSWGFWQATQNNNGTSGTTEPVGYGIGDTFTDNDLTWALQKLGGNSLSNKLGEDANGNLTYNGTAVYKDTRTIVFAGTSFQIAYPYDGTLQNLTAVSSMPLTTAAEFTIEKINNTDYAAGKSWTIMGLGKYKIDINQNYMEQTISSNNKLDAGDIVRISTTALNLGSTVFHLYVKNY